MTKHVGDIKIVNTIYKVFMVDNFQEINNLGSEYDKKYGFESKEGAKINGFTLTGEKEIYFYTGFSNVYADMTLRHEITHATLFELGYSHWNDEELVEKISLWIPIINEIEKQAKGLIKDARHKEKPRSKKEN